MPFLSATDLSRCLGGRPVIGRPMKRALAALFAFALLGAGPVESVQIVPLSGNGALPYPSVVVVWATWCVPCARELPLALGMAPAAAPLPMVSLALDPPDKAAARLAQLKITPHRAFAAPGDIGTVLRTLGGAPASLPLVFALNAKGDICGVRHGLLGGDQLRQWAGTCSR